MAQALLSILLIHHTPCYLQGRVSKLIKLSPKPHIILQHDPVHSWLLQRCQQVTAAADIDRGTRCLLHSTAGKPHYCKKCKQQLLLPGPGIHSN